MSEVEDAISYVFMWHALSDACPKCQALNGKEWLDQDLFTHTVWDSVYGDVWDLDADHSLAHGAQQYNCRCQLEVRVAVELDELNEYAEFRELLRMF